MKHQLKKLGTLLGSMLMILPTASYGGVGTLADQPLWMAASVKHNIMLSIDDSGSMDWETLFDNQDGLIAFSDTSQSFVDANGKFLSSGNAWYGYLFPNGSNSTYDGRRLYTSIRAIPPVKAYAFARSADYNHAYYNPNDTYTPWPSYGGFTFSNSNPAAAPFEPISSLNTGAGTLDLTQYFNTASKGSYWDFDLRNGMVYKDDGSTYTSNNRRDYTYYPATYYVKITTGTYTYDPNAGSSGSGSAGGLTTSNAALFEGEDGTLTAPMMKGSDMGTPYDLLNSNPTAIADASGADFAGVRNSEADHYNNPPTVGNAAYTFSNLTGRVAVWVRVWFDDGDHDSFWFNVDGNATVDTSTLSDTATAPTTPNDDGKTWYRWKDNNVTTGQWDWEKWGEINVVSGAVTINVKPRESGAYLDQLLVTTDLSYTPSGQEFLSTAGGSVSGITRSCATDVSPIYYHEFKIHPERYIGVDAIGPDGACLKKYEIKPGNTFPSGRSYADEIQNFANWFTYYRRRHQAMRGGMASALQGLTGIRVGLFWLNNQRTVTMRDWENSSDVATLLDEHYKRVRPYGTPIKTSLKHAGNQFDSNSTIITEECQKNFTLVFTDGFNTDVSDLTGIANEDGSAGAPYQDNVSDTIADVAWYYYNKNLNSSLPAGKVAVPDACKDGTADDWEDCNTNLHMNTYVATLGTKGSIFGVTHNSIQDAYSTPPTWPAASQVGTSSSIYQVDDLYHAAVNGRGEMYNAQSPKDLQQKLNDALRDIIKKIGSGSGVTFNTASLQTDTLLYSATFNSSSWSGELEAKELDSDGKVKSTAWQASKLLDARDLTNDPRVILTYKSDAATPDGVPFQWSDLPAIGQQDLNYVGTSSSGDGLGQDRLAYLRGDRSKESGVFRSRSSRLGDIINSSPVVVGKPNLSWPDKDPFGVTGDRYSAFKNGQITKYTNIPTRDTMIYVGANDGMLHGFDASSGANGGKEKLAYVPAALYSTATGRGLRYLTDPNYQHRYYVDLTPVASDVYIKTSASSTAGRSWRTILVGGLRAGGRGLFALDVTNPNDFSENPTNAANTVLWEFTSNDDPDLGYITEPPVVAMMNNDKWAVIFGNGYGSTSGASGTQGTGKVFIVFIEGGLDGTWSATDYVKLDTGVVAGVSGVAVADTDGDKIADRIYAGDDNGNMWAFDVTGSNTNKWGSAFSTGGTPKPLFIAKDSSGNRQPITAAPGIQLHPEVKSSPSNEPNILVVFGTGKYLSNGDQADTQVQSFYTVWDKGQGNLTRSDLESRSLADTATTRTISGSTINWNNDDGFYFDFSTVSGERLVHKPLLRNDYAIFVTTIPDSSACAGGGSSWLMVVPLGDGLTPSTPVIDMDGDGDVDANDAISSGKKLDDINNKPAHLSKKIYTSKSDQSSGTGSCGAGVNCTEVDLGEKTIQEGRMGWHELFRK
ncbi:PilC/PilY family type IV pilus protein [Hahella sp. SMD15-11]|uniref:PilC/PilY family type IV pilus protein n=1 Tax=Thermohahella caldifontis TaxID=3142973 RepID=A0AB39UTH9_9GAMM